MSDTIEFQLRVGPDGMLNLQVPLGHGEAGTEVVVTIRPVPPYKKNGRPVDWHQFVEETYGSCSGLGIERPTAG